MGMFLKDINLKGKTALITGATKGLGRGAAIAIAEAGGNIIAISALYIIANALGIYGAMQMWKLLLQLALPPLMIWVDNKEVVDGWAKGRPERRGRRWTPPGGFQ